MEGTHTHSLPRTESTLSYETSPVKWSARAGPSQRATENGGARSDTTRDLQDRLLEWALDRSDVTLDSVLHEAAARGLTHSDVLTRMLTPAAQRLGEWWDDDLISFMDVTLGAGKLRRVLHRLRSPHLRAPARGQRLLLRMLLSDQHTLGIAVAEQLLWLDGFDTALNFDPDPTASDCGCFDAVAIGVPALIQVDALRRLVDGSRRHAVRESGRVWLAGLAASEDLAETVGADGFVKGPAQLSATMTLY